MVQFSEETKERVSKVIDISRVAIHYEPKPSLFKYVLNEKPYHYSLIPPTREASSNPGFRLFSPLA
ncbi:Tom7-domain-containing protein [Penicillium malachiteum]|uniref:Tom7-domain-containing protein n=1 Tax=Penicillium malachiteum TaxID=1324776 RepID=A0AAD6MUI5_9EURO|nr:Tom7-domain-containing protein [Penicillium malachiteum]